MTGKSFQKPDELFSPAPCRAAEASGGWCTAPEPPLAQNSSGVGPTRLPDSIWQLGHADAAVAE